MRNTPTESPISDAAFRNLKTAMTRNRRPSAGLRREPERTEPGAVSGSESKADNAAMLYFVRQPGRKVWDFFKRLQKSLAADIRRSPAESLPAWQSSERARGQRGWRFHKCWP